MLMLPVVLRNLLGRCATRPYPRQARQPFAGSRGQLVNDAGSCILCGTCARVCPSQCLTVSRKDGLWQYEPFACICCGVCVEACPSGSLTQLGRWRPAVRERERVVMEVRREK
ncbi:MAG: 4Fe-4S dicluster domain-containing protein [Desulfurivibrio sp.]|nr:MAG: 4Fe-4S dicluster domain-containing protein [Desulfurivibrio sp.]